MVSLDTLPPDQRAVLQLVLQRGRSFDEIAQMLSIDRAAVRDRALAALDSLGPQTRVPAERRALITDYLLGQLPPKVGELTRRQLAASAPDRAWARVLAAELAPLAAAPLPEIPPAAEVGNGEAPGFGATAGLERPAEAGLEEELAGGEELTGSPAEAEDAEPSRAVEEEPAPSAPAVPPVPAASSVPAAPSAPAAGAVARSQRGAAARAQQQERAAPSAPASEYGRPDRERPRPSSRRGGAIVLGMGALVAVAVIVVVVVLLSGGGAKHHSSRIASRPRTTKSSTPTTPAGSSAQVVSKITLTSPLSKSTKGAAEIVRESGQLGLVLVGVGVPANSAHNAYAVWLSNGGADSTRLGFVNPGVKSNGQLRAAAALPTNASHYKELLVTLETTSAPKVPGKVVLEGPLGLS